MPRTAREVPPPLELLCLRALWTLGEGNVKAVQRIVAESRPLAYTTIMTTLDRLYKKHLLDRTAEGRAFRYSPRFSQEQLQRALAGHAIQNLLHSSRTSSLPLSYLVEAVSEHDSQLLDQLQQLVERKRRELRKKGGER